MEAVKTVFRNIRDDIAEGMTGEVAAQKVIAILEKLQSEYTDIY